MSAFRLGLGASFIGGLAIRLIDVSISGPIRTPDSAGFTAAAEALRGSLFTSADIFIGRPPLYPVLLAVLPSDRSVVIAQALLSAAVVPLVGLATARWYGPLAGVTAAVAAAVMPPFIEWTPYILSDVLALAVFALAVERLSGALASTGARRSAFAGIAGALGVLTRPAYAASTVALALASMLPRELRLARVMFFTLAAIATVVPFLARNAAATGMVEVYEGRGWATIWEGTQWNEHGRGTAGVDVTLPRELSSMSSAQQSEFFRRESLRAFTSDPVGSVSLMAKKAFWYVVPFYPEWSLKHKIVSAATLGALYVLAVAGTLTRWRSAFTGSLLLVSASFVVTAMLSVVDYDARYRLPFVLCLIPLAAVGAAEAVGRVTRSFPRVRVADESPVVNA